MTFLKKLGQFLAKAGAIAVNIAGVAAGIGPIIAPYIGTKAAGVVGTVTNDLTLMAQQVVTIETALQGKTGADKLTALIPLVGGVLSTSELIAGKKIANEALYTKAVQEYAQASVDLLNAIHGESVPNPTPTPAP